MPRTSSLTSSAQISPDDASLEEMKALRVLLERATEDLRTSTLTRALLRALAEVEAGRRVTILATETSLTPNEAAELLGVSRPLVVRLLDQGVLPSEHLPGSRHRVIRLADVMDFADQRKNRQTGRRRIASAMHDAGLEY